MGKGRNIGYTKFGAEKFKERHLGADTEIIFKWMFN
jgi:hypothetical protein